MKPLLTRHFYRAVCWLVLLGAPVAAWAQAITVQGVVRDAKTKAKLPFVSVAVPAAGIGTTTDQDGHYTLQVPAGYTSLVFSYLGYRSATQTLVPGQPQLDVLLVPSAAQLGEVVIKGTKPPRYKNKENPAVALIRQVIAHKAENQPERYDYVEYEKYEKMTFSFSNLSAKFKNRKVFKNYQVLFKQQDSAAAGGATILPIYIEEKLAREYYRRDPAQRRAIALGSKQVEFDKHFIDNEGLSAYFNRMYQDIDIYANNVTLLGNQLLSPIADNAPTFYQFYISDTLRQHVPQLVELSFFPRTKGDMLFVGKLYVTLDGHYAVQQANLLVDKRINLNFVKSLHATLNFAKNPDRRYHLSKSFLGIDFGVSEKGSGFYGERRVSFDKYLVDKPEPDSLYTSVARPAPADSTAARAVAFLERNRPDSLTQVEKAIYRNVDTLQTIKSFQRTLTLFTFLFSGYKSFGPFEVGPSNTFYSFNPVEGLRLRVGGRTTPELSKRLYFETYAAYGFKDERWKYFLSGAYALNGKSIYTFPQHFVRGSFQRDTRIPEQDLQFVQEDNFLLSFKRGVNDRYLYNDVYRLDYVREFRNHLGYTLGFRKLQQSPAGGLYFRTAAADNSATINTLTTNELSLQVRWAPKETFYQGKLYRTPIIGPYPIFTARVATGIRGFFGGEYSYTNVLASASKRVYLSQLGHADVTLEGGYVLGQVPYPLLVTHRANQTFSYQLNSYNLMNFLEFSSDHYASLFIDQNFNGFFFNRLPLIKTLKLRETASLKLLYGGIRAENDPALHPELYQFLRDGAGQPVAFALGRQPYAEASVGVANIFKLFRLDVVKRLTYLSNPNVAEWGLRGRFRLDF